MSMPSAEEHSDIIQSSWHLVNVFFGRPTSQVIGMMCLLSVMFKACIIVKPYIHRRWSVVVLLDKAMMSQ